MTEESKIDALVEELRTRIKRGDFGTEGRLPAVTKIAKDHKMARETASEVLRLLQSEGLLIAKDRSYFVNYPIHRISGAPLFDKYLEKLGLTHVTENVTEPEIIQIPDEIAEFFNQDRAIRVVHRMRKHGTEKAWMRLQDSYYPYDLVSPYLDAMKQDVDLNVLGEVRKATGLTFTKRHDDVIGRLPTSQEVKLLEIVRTTPVLEIRRQFLTADDKPLLFAKVTLVAAYFVISYDSDKNGGRL